MKQPDVRSSIRDPGHNVVYHVLAYRPLSREELVRSVRMYHRSQPAVRRRKTPLRNAEVTIATTLGRDGTSGFRIA